MGLIEKWLAHGLRLTVTLLCMSLMTAGAWAYTVQQYSKHGAVYTRSIVPGPNGNPVYVEYNERGAEAAEIGEMFGELADAKVMAAEEYRSWLAQYTTVTTDYPDFELVTKEEYEAGNYTTVNNEPITKPPLKSSTVTVVLRPPLQRLTTDSDQLVLLQLPIDPNQTIQDLTRSLLLMPDGTIHHQTANNIGYRTAFFGNEDDPLGLAWDRKASDTIYGPLENVVVGMLETYRRMGGIATTTERGTYGMIYSLPPCPGFTFRFNTSVYLDLYYKRFNPRSNPTFPYYLMREDEDTCWGLPTGGAIDYNQASLDFPVDLIVLAGKARLAKSDGSNISVGDQTTFDHEQAALERTAQQQYDFDGDNQPDTAKLGRIETDEEGNKSFVELAPDANPEIQGVWLSSLGNDPLSTLPDLTRLPDWTPDFNDRGLLNAISKEDFLLTDLYIFRESDGTLVMERKGLRNNEFAENFYGVDEQISSFYYTIPIVGGIEGIFNRFGYTHGGEDVFEQWQASGKMNEAFHQRASDHLRAGENVRIIAINRSSGYVGSITTPVKTASDGENDYEVSFHIDDIVMRPPNLKIWAEREYRVEEGATKNDTREYTIGNEGSGLSNDTVVTIFTEWLDDDDRPLPEELGDYGFTGRVAKVIARDVWRPFESNRLFGHR